MNNLVVSINGGTPKSSILDWDLSLNHPAIKGYPHLWKSQDHLVEYHRLSRWGIPTIPNNQSKLPLNHWTTGWQKRCKAAESHSDVMTLTVVDPGISSSGYVKSCKITRQPPVVSNICSCDVLLLLIWGLCSCISNFVSYNIFGHTYTRNVHPLNLNGT